MRASDFPKGKDGKRFKVVEWQTGNGEGPWTKSVFATSCHRSIPPEMIADALERVAEWEERFANGEVCFWSKKTEDGLATLPVRVEFNGGESDSVE